MFLKMALFYSLWLNSNKIFFFWLHSMWDLSEPGPMAVKAPSSNHWRVREFS